MTNGKIQQKEIDRLANRLSAMGRQLLEARAMAFRLAKENNLDAIHQLRGAFSGAAMAARSTDEFLGSLKEILSGRMA